MSKIQGKQIKLDLNPNLGTSDVIVSSQHAIKQYVDSKVATAGAAMYQDVIPANTPSPYVFFHNLNTYDYIVTVYDDVTKEDVIVNLDRIDENNLSVEYGENPNQLVILIFATQNVISGGAGTAGHGDTSISNARNGLTKIGINVELGGKLIQDTLLDGDGAWNMSFLPNAWSVVAGNGIEFINPTGTGAFQIYHGAANSFQITSSGAATTFDVGHYGSGNFNMTNGGPGNMMIQNNQSSGSGGEFTIQNNASGTSDKFSLLQNGGDSLEIKKSGGTGGLTLQQNGGDADMLIQSNSGNNILIDAVGGAVNLTANTTFLAQASGTKIEFLDTNNDFTIGAPYMDIEAISNVLYINGNRSGLEINGTYIHQSSNNEINITSSGGNGIYLDASNVVSLVSHGGNGIQLDSSNNIEIRANTGSATDFHMFFNNGASFELVSPEGEFRINNGGQIQLFTNSFGNVKRYGITLDYVGALVYDSDYSADYVDLTLVHKKYVDDKIFEASTAGNASPYQENQVDVAVFTSATYNATQLSHFLHYNGSTASTVNLPAVPKMGQQIVVSDITGNAVTNNITINGNGYLINGSSSATIDTSYGSIMFIFNGINWAGLAFVS